MNFLKAMTRPTELDDTFDIRWTNTIMRPRGVIRVKVSDQIEDRHIVAELSALKHLLEEKEVLGKNLAGGAKIKLIVSHGAIRKLQRNQSDKGHLVPYVNFLTTRFADCQITVDKDTSWFDGTPPETFDNLLVTGPQRETLMLKGFGEVAVTQHVIERYIDRFLPGEDQTKATNKAWRKLSLLTSDSSVREVSRKSLWAGVHAQDQGRQEGRYFLNRKHDLVMIVASDRRGQKQLVTVYRANYQFRELAKAA